MPVEGADATGDGALAQIVFGYELMPCEAGVRAGRVAGMTTGVAGSQSAHRISAYRSRGARGRSVARRRRAARWRTSARS
ncbi:hypothetical protein PT2222_220144 [Paraburkholderia tropica]